MQKSIIIVFLITGIFLSISNLFSFPGDHSESYSCETFRRTDCSDETSFDPANPIKDACGPYVHNPSYHFTMFGDSLTDLVHDYGLFQFEEYFAVSGHLGLSIQNFGLAGWDTDMIALDMGAVSPDRISARLSQKPIFLNRNKRRCEPLGNHTYPWIPLNNNRVVPNKTSSRTIVMAGGNDILHSGLYSVVFPFLKPHVIEHSSYNIRQMIDWNLENGKSILLLGTIPPDSVGLKDYNPTYVNRYTLCKGITPPEIGPFPWWTILLVPGGGEIVAELLNQIREDYIDFYNKVWTDPEKGFPITASITQACLNDKLYFDVYKVYNKYYNTKTDKPVQILPLYDFFSSAPDPAKNYWVPNHVLYKKFTDFRTMSNSLLTELLPPASIVELFLTYNSIFYPYNVQLPINIDYPDELDSLTPIQPGAPLEFALNQFTGAFDDIFL